MKIIHLIEQNDQLIYHITTKSNWETIKRQGILPQDASGSWAHIGYKNKTFVFTDAEPEAIEELVATLVGKHDGWDEWESDRWDEFTDSLLLLIIKPDLVPNLKLERDPSSMEGDWFRTSDPIPPRAIIDVQPLSVWLS